MVDAAFNQIRQSAAHSPAVLIQLARILCALATVADDEAQQASVLSHLHKLRRSAHKHIEDEADLADFEAVIAPIMGEGQST